MGASRQKKCKIFIPTWTKKDKNPAFDVAFDHEIGSQYSKLE